MNILLVGDYSGVHSELSRGLKALGHQVVVISDGDGYKNFSRDIDFGKNKNSSSDEESVKNGALKFLIKKFRSSHAIELIKLIREFSGLKGVFSYFKRRKDLDKLKDFDIVQLINPIAIESFGSIANFMLIRKLRNNNKSIFLCALGDDAQWVNSCIRGIYKYSPLDGYNWRRLRDYSYSMRYKYGFFFGTLNLYCLKVCKKIIPGLYDYKLAYSGNIKCTDVAPLPISENDFCQPNKTSYPVKIFHGWQVGKELRKGNHLIHEAVNKIIAEYGEGMVKYSVAKSIPFSEYRKAFKNSDILMDQCFSYDRGVNATLGMCSGKVVFSGFENGSVILDQEKVGINSAQSADDLYLQLKELIENIDLIDEIKFRAHCYSRKYHESKFVASRYIDIWTSK